MQQEVTCQMLSFSFQKNKSGWHIGYPFKKTKSKHTGMIFFSCCLFFLSLIVFPNFFINLCFHWFFIIFFILSINICLIFNWSYGAVLNKFRNIGFVFNFVSVYFLLYNFLKNLLNLVESMTQVVDLAS